MEDRDEYRQVPCYGTNAASGDGLDTDHRAERYDEVHIFILVEFIHTVSAEATQSYIKHRQRSTPPQTTPEYLPISHLRATVIGIIYSTRTSKTIHPPAIFHQERKHEDSYLSFISPIYISLMEHPSH